MSYKMIKKLMISGVVASSLVISAQSEEGNYILATASTGGTYYPVGVALATLTKVKLQPKQKIGMSAINSAGSGENVRLLRENEAQFAILQGLYGHYAATGTGPLEKEGKQDKLRSITMLWQNVEQFIIDKSKVTSGTADDLITLKGSKMAMGKKNSGTLGSNKALLSGLTIDVNADYELVHSGYGPSADALQNGQVSGVGIPSGTPTGAITKLFASAEEKVQMLNITDSQLVKMDGGRNLWTRYIIEANTYPGQTKAINTMAQPNFLAVSDSVSEDHVYQITKTIYENLPFLNAIHKVTKAMAVEKAISGLPLPLHSGAVKYYKEIGITIPESLIAQ